MSATATRTHSREGVRRLAPVTDLQFMAACSARDRLGAGLLMAAAAAESPRQVKRGIDALARRREENGDAVGAKVARAARHVDPRAMELALAAQGIYLFRERS